MLRVFDVLTLKITFISEYYYEFLDSIILFDSMNLLCTSSAQSSAGTWHSDVPSSAHQFGSVSDKVPDWKKYILC